MPEDDLQAQFEAVAFDPDRDLAKGKDGRPFKSLNNTVAVLSKCPDWSGVIAFDEFSGRIVKLKPPPFDYGAELGEWTDLDDVRAQSWIARRFGFEPLKGIMVDAVRLAADQNRIHEVRTYLRGLTWDKTPRLDTWLVEYLGAGAFYEKDDSDEEKKRKDATNLYLRSVGSLWMLSAVARIMSPGCKADYVLILEGPQQTGKSSTLAILGGAWFTDAAIKIGDKDALQILRGKWIIELPELDALGRSEASAQKAFLSVSVDRYRASYGVRPIDVPRQCVFGGTVNHEQYFKDDSGNRRFWPVETRGADLARLREDRDQLWAEAVARYDAGESWEPNPELKAAFDQEQEKRYIGDAWETVILKWLGENLSRDRLSTADIFGEVLHIERTRWSRPEQMRVGSILRRLGWSRKRDAGGWYYLAPPIKRERATQVDLNKAEKDAF